MNHYQRLGILPDSSFQDIKDAFYALMKRHHPDHGGDAEVARSMIEAYEVIMDPEKRSRHDLFCRQFYRQDEGVIYAGPDKRSFRRVLLKQKIRVKSGQGMSTFQFVDYSSGGAKISGEPLYQEGQSVELILEDGLPMGWARVVYSNHRQNTMGLKWTHVNPENIPKGFIRSLKL